MPEGRVMARYGRTSSLAKVKVLETGSTYRENTRGDKSVKDLVEIPGTFVLWFKGFTLSTWRFFFFRHASVVLGSWYTTLVNQVIGARVRVKYHDGEQRNIEQWWLTTQQETR